MRVARTDGDLRYRVPLRSEAVSQPSFGYAAYTPDDAGNN